MDIIIEKIVNNPLFLQLKNVIENNPWHDHESVYDHLIKTHKTADEKISGNFITNPHAKKLFLDFVNENLGGVKRKDLILVTALIHDIEKVFYYKHKNNEKILTRKNASKIIKIPQQKYLKSNIVAELLKDTGFSQKNIEIISKIVKLHDTFNDSYFYGLKNKNVNFIINDIKSKAEGFYIEALFNIYCDVYYAKISKDSIRKITEIFNSPYLYTNKLLHKMKIPLFDIDGTLFKTENSIHFDAFTHTFKTIYGIDANQKEIEPEGMLDHQIIIDVLKLHGVSEDATKEKLETATLSMPEYVRKNIKEKTFEPLLGVKELLEELNQLKTYIGILSGNIEEIAWIKIENAKLKKYFSFGAFGDNAFKRVDLVKIAKTNAEKKLKKKFKTSDFVIIGDTPRDIECARQAGIKVIAVATGIFSFEDLAIEKPDLLLNSFEKKEDRESIINFLLT